MGIKDRRTTVDGRRTTDLVRPRAVETLDNDQDLSQDEIFVDGIPVIAPGNFGSDGKDHHNAILAVSPSGMITSFRH